MSLSDGIDDENGDDALEEPAGDAASGEGAEAADEGGEGSRRKRRRRRGRRGRGRGHDGAQTGAGPNGSDAKPPEDEPVVPRGVVAHELMPAATGGRRRGRRGGRGRRHFGGEPADPQLISPQNPVPKPRFGEDKP
jgi:ribonuclease E